MSCVLRGPAVRSARLFGRSLRAIGSRPDDQGWTLTSDANVFFGYNYQHRKFTDFSAWESQNWFMLDAERRSARAVSCCTGCRRSSRSR